MRKHLGLLMCCIFAMGQLFAQERLISGKVTDASGNPVVSASVTVRGSQGGTTTDANGVFTLRVSATVKKITVSAVDFAAQDITIGSSDQLTIQLTPKTKDLDEVVVVAYGTVKKSENTSSTAQINYDKFKNRPLTNITSALEGAAPGIQSLSASGQPGSSSTIRLRGFGSLNASNDPLYIVDGVAYSGGLSNINMDDVESISALKDAASTALYGSRAANGVIIITTKRGKKNRSQLSFKVSQGFSSRAIPEYDRVNAFQYYPLMWQALKNSLQYGSGQAPATASQNATNTIKASLGYNPFNVANNDIVKTDGTLNPNAQLLWADDLDWNKELVRTGSRQEYGLSYNGGSDKSDYFASFSYVSEKGFIIKSDLSKFTGRINLNVQPVSWFKSGLNLSGTITRSNTANDAGSTSYVNPFFFTRNMGPIYPVYAHNQTTGDYMLNSFGKRFYDYGNLSALGIPNRPAGGSPGRHVIEETKLNDLLFKRNILSARSYAEIDFTKDLYFTTNISVDLTNYDASEYRNPLVGDAAPIGSSTRTSATVTSYTFNQLLNYRKNIQDHHFALLAGHENYDLNTDTLQGSRNGQVVVDNTELANFATTTALTSFVNKQRVESYLSRLTYDFNNKYFLTGSFRRDGNSRFKKEFRWANFWSVGAAWRIDKEKFLNAFPQIDQLKLRASYGRVGNDGGIGYYPYQALYSLGYTNASEPGIRQLSLPNDSITWEAAKNADVAVEFSLFKGRLQGTVEYYHRTTDDLIFGVQLPLSNGGYVLNKNIGSMVNKGWEVQLGGDIIREKDFSWRMDINWSTLQNRITQMPVNQPEIISGTKKLSVGHSIYDYWLRDYQGVDPSDGSALYRAASYVPANSRIRGKEDTVTTSQNNAQLIYAGSAIPDFYGSIVNTFTYKSFELSVLLTYQVGGKVYDATYASLMSPGTYGNAMHTDALSSWQKAGDVTNTPRMDNSKGGVFDAVSNRWLTSASFLNLRSVSVSYNLPKSLIAKVNATSARFFVSGENLQWFSARKGMNVQQSFTGVTSNVFVPARMVSAGLNVNF